jgi:hypothetical protein
MWKQMSEKYVTVVKVNFLSNDNMVAGRSE